MSLGESTKTFDRKLKQLKKNGKLILSKDLVMKIHYLHHRTGSSEWSGILVYKIVSGNMEEPTTLVLKAVDLIFMDIGTATYTEYDLSASDDYMMDRLGEVADGGYKLGHIHTHHNMTCYFSGVDTGELHDNAPNHNFYLSLIVNNKEPNNWCAAIAICVDEIQKGNVKRTGNVTTTTKFKGEDGLVEKTISTDINEDNVLDETESILYKVDMDISMEVENPGHIIDRYNDLSDKKYAKTYYPHNNFNIGVAFEKKNKSNNGKGGDQKVIGFPAAGEKEKGEKSKEEQEESQMREQNCFSPGKVKPFLIKFLGSDPEQVTLDVAVNAVSERAKFPQTWQYDLGKMEERFQHKIDEFFKIDSDEADAHCVAIACIDMLTTFKYGLLKELTKEVIDLLELFVLTEKMYPGITLVTETLTGIVEEEPYYPM